MTFLDNGNVLIAGGENCTSATSCNPLSGAEIYNPVAGYFHRDAQQMSAARVDASAVRTQFRDGPLVAGGFNG